ncbi:MAG: FtsW/RodA/SpoVE family cell cycle protein [Fimbriimonadales bacterium]|nr:FtsW/RodA/SpoVE family cell cycle protein [Fimbriimonadales bacterium]MDW8052371.1 FtsW/RodA/SpoVE family cell cycle protein [Armatimonadota bacterium]
MRRVNALRGTPSVIALPSEGAAAPARATHLHPFAVGIPLALAGIGLVFQASVGVSELLRWSDSSMSASVWRVLRPALMQVLWLLLGVAVMGICAQIRGRLWVATAWLWLLLGLGSLAWLELGLPGSVSIQGATRWLGFKAPGIGTITVQPAEFYKLATLLWFVGIYSAQRPRWSFGTRLGTLLWLGGVALVALQPDKDTAVLVFLIGLTVAFLGGLPWRNLLLGLLVLAVVGGAFVVTPIVLSVARNQPLEQQPGAYVAKRVLAMLNPKAYAHDTAYQMLRAQIAVGSGGLMGVGIGAGREKRHLPAAENDYIFATIAEETGLVGSLTVLGLFALLVWACFESAARAPTRMGRLYLMGLGGWIGIGALMNLSMAVGLLPTMGLPLPFVSAGGSALVSLMAAIGIGAALMREAS